MSLENKHFNGNFTNFTMRLQLKNVTARTMFIYNIYKIVRQNRLKRDLAKRLTSSVNETTYLLEKNDNYPRKRKCNL